eukprot:15250122-Alexandrium_andersonii.AAC.1
MALVATSSRPARDIVSGRHLFAAQGAGITGGGLHKSRLKRLSFRSIDERSRWRRRIINVPRVVKR